PADDSYIVSVPIFEKVKMKLNDRTVTITRKNDGTKISRIAYDGKQLDGYFIPYRELEKGKRLTIETTSPESK
ncbi:MAG TPA: glycoside hydrolase domain-containing protein, partial [Verrucomicrobiae bacterium]